MGFTLARCHSHGVEITLMQLALLLDADGFADADDLAREPLNGASVTDDGKPAPPARLSHSGASTFDQCPRRWRFRYVDRLPDLPGEPALIGTFAHRVLELLLQEAPEARTVERARQIARAEWPSFSDNGAYKALGLDQFQQRHFRLRAWKAIEGLWDLEDPVAVDVTATEEHVTATLGEVPFRGVVDRIEAGSDGLVVTDYKSGRAPSARYAADRLYQVMLYAAAVAEHHPTPPARARLYYLGQTVLDAEVTESSMAEAVERLQRTWADIVAACKSDSFEPRPGAICEYCSYAEHCPEGKQLVELRQAERKAQEESLARLAATV